MSNPDDINAVNVHRESITMAFGKFNKPFDKYLKSTHLPNDRKFADEVFQGQLSLKLEFDKDSESYFRQSELNIQTRQPVRIDLPFETQNEPQTNQRNQLAPCLGNY